MAFIYTNTRVIRANSKHNIHKVKDCVIKKVFMQSS